jgi:hypothetical protein
VITAAVAGRGPRQVPHLSWRDPADALWRREARPGAVPLPRAKRTDGVPRAQPGAGAPRTQLGAAGRSGAAAPPARPDAAARSGAAAPPPPGLARSGSGRVIAVLVLTGLAAVPSLAARRCEAPRHRAEWPAAPWWQLRAGLLPPVGSAQHVARRGGVHCAAGCLATQSPGGSRSAVALWVGTASQTVAAARAPRSSAQPARALHAAAYRRDARARRGPAAAAAAASGPQPD